MSADASGPSTRWPALRSPWWVPLLGLLCLSALLLTAWLRFPRAVGGMAYTHEMDPQRLYGTLGEMLLGLVAPYLFVLFCWKFRRKGTDPIGEQVAALVLVLLGTGYAARAGWSLLEANASHSADLLYERGDYEPALDAMREAAQLNPAQTKKLVMQLLGRGAELAQQGEQAQGFALLDEAVQRGPDMYLPLVTRGQVYRKLGKSEEALRDLRAAQKMVPDDARVADMIQAAENALKSSPSP